MIQTLVIIEDEKPNVDRLKRLLQTIKPKVEILAVLDSINDSVDWFTSHPQPDVVLMDVRLSDGLSFEIFDRITLSCPVIFTTAFDEYAVKAFKYNSVDYLLKPVEADELLAAISKVELLPGRLNQTTLEGILNFFQPKDYRNRFLLPYRDAYKSLLVTEVAYFYSELKITRAKLLNGAEDIVPQTLEELEQQLNPKLFFRANRQYIIGIDAIHQVHNYFNGKLKIDIKNSPDLEIIVSRDKAQLLKNWLDF
ncbi:MAG TPA: DNA-binding response regulator [Runella sp.]|nr:DNA-binding response regulator [Runella sp.]